MELDEKSLNGEWSYSDNNLPEFFIINEALISKLCILGEDTEPCFEGANITKATFSFDDSFNNRLFSMMNELKDILNGGSEKMDQSMNSQLDNENEIVEQEVETTFSDTSEEIEPQIESAEEVTDYAEKKKDKEEENEDKNDSEDSDNSDNNTEEENSETSEDDEEEKKKKKETKTYSVEEYEELNTKYEELNVKYSTLEQEIEVLKSDNASLTQFKNNVERAQKQDMIDNTFYMLSDIDKADVIANIDTYSLDEIEAKLSVICVRNKVSFNNEISENEPISYNLQDQSFVDSTPAWIVEAMKTAQSL